VRRKVALFYLPTRIVSLTFHATGARFLNVPWNLVPPICPDVLEVPGPFRLQFATAAVCRLVCGFLAYELCHLPAFPQCLRKE
jgi:hypothetical protein